MHFGTCCRSVLHAAPAQLAQRDGPWRPGNEVKQAGRQACTMMHDDVLTAAVMPDNALLGILHSMPSHPALS